MDWSFLKGGAHPVYELDDDGNLCFRHVDGAYIALDDPRVADLVQSIDKQQRERFAEAKAAWDEIHASISDPANDQPIPLEILRQKPKLCAWLNGEAVDYKPTVAEYRMLYPAFIERRRRLRERAISAPAADNAADIEKKLPRSQRIRNCIEFVNRHRRKVHAGMAPQRHLRDLIAEFSADEAEQTSLERALRPDRNGKHLVPELAADK